MTTHNDETTARLMAHAQASADILADYWNGDATTDDGDKATIYDWINDQLAVKVMSTLDRNYLYCEIEITVGGPYVYLSTGDHAIYARDAGNETAVIGIPSEVIDAIDNVVAEYWDSN